MESTEKSKYEQMLSQYDIALKDSEVAAKVAAIVEKCLPENDTLEVKKFLMGSIELTTLKATDSDETVLAFTERVNKFEDTYPDLPHVATICVYPCYAKIVSQALEVEGVEVVCASGAFP
ncbi:MAG: deoxyribose-phosphate aldolase, partial [Bacteroidaceae bacterium]|nr:deoxyribose-phosphate aldolase [Bacteroidaceae bacterium]